MSKWMQAGGSLRPSFCYGELIHSDETIYGPPLPFKTPVDTLGACTPKLLALQLLQIAMGNLRFMKDRKRTKGVTEGHP
jgi:hypothetical protein